MSQRGLESRANHLAHEKRRCVVAPARSSFVGVHHAFEHTAKHVRRDEFAVIVLADGEMESLEQLVERVAPLGVGPDGRAVPPFERRGLEESAIEEWDLAQCPRDGAPVRRGAIQRAEAEGVQKGAMKVTPGGERTVEQTRHVSRIAVQPALRLDEVEEEHPGERR